MHEPLKIKLSNNDLVTIMPVLLFDRPGLEAFCKNNAPTKADYERMISICECHKEMIKDDDEIEAYYYNELYNTAKKHGLYNWNVTCLINYFDSKKLMPEVEGFEGTIGTPFSSVSGLRCIR